MNKCKLGDIASSQTGPFGSQLHEEDYVKEGIPIVTVEHLGDIGFTTQNLPFVSEQDAERLSKYTLMEGDIVFSRVGAIDRCVFTKKEQEGWLFSGRCIRVRCDSSKVNSRYLSYYFKLPFFKKMMLNLSVGATMPSLNTHLMDNVELNLLDRESQDKIATFLNNIDSKIENNNKIISELESMTKTIYDYWFLQFEFPNENGKPYKSSGGKMVWNEKLQQDIPADWELKTIGDLVVENEKSTIQTKQVAKCGNVPFFTSGDSILLTKLPLVDGFNCFLNTGGNAGVKIYDGKASYSTDTWCITSKDEYKYILAMYLKKIESYMDTKFFAGTGLKHLQKPLLKSEPIIIANQNVLDKFNKIISKNFELISKNKTENQKLASLRDFLLPMLMNGQVTFKEEA